MIQLLNSRHKHVRKTAKAVLRSTPILYVATYPKMLENTEDEESGSETEDEEDNLRQKRGSKISVRKTFQRLHVHVPHIQKDKEKKNEGKKSSLKTEKKEKRSEYRKEESSKELKEKKIKKKIRKSKQIWKFRHFWQLCHFHCSTTQKKIKTQKRGTK